MTYVHQKKFDRATPASRLDLLHALVAEGTVCIDSYHTNTPDKAVFDRRYYSDKAPGTAALALLPFSAASRMLGAARVSLNSKAGWLFSSWVACAGSIAILAALGGVAIFKWLSTFVSERSALIVVLALFLGAAPLPYSTMMFSHALVIGLIGISIWAIDHQGAVRRGQSIGSGKKQTSNRKWDLMAGFACGWALASEFSSGLVILGIAVWLLSMDRRRIVPFGLAAVPPLLLIPAYSWACFGDLFTLPYSHQASFPAMKEGVYAIKWPDAETAFNLLFSPARGLLFWTPFLGLAAVGYWRLAQRSPSLFWLCYAIPVLHIAVISGRMWDWSAGPTLGPRLLAPIIPLLALPSAYGLGKLPGTGIALAIYSIGITTLATLTDACPSFRNNPNPLMDWHIPLFLKAEFSPNLAQVIGLSPYPSVALYYLVLIGGTGWLWRRLGNDQRLDDILNRRRERQEEEGAMRPSQAFIGRSPTKGFSLIELLVVVGILALLLALTLPALKYAHGRAISTQCANNLRQLQLSWQMYADDFDGWVAPNRSYERDGIWRSTPDSWIGNSSALFDKDTSAIEAGLIFRYDYNRAIRTYRCPADDSTVVSTDILRSRSYSMNGTFGGNYDPKKADEVARTISRVSQVRKPSRLFVFVDEHEDSIDDAHFLVWPAPDHRWVNMPADRHDRKGTVSFVDGHVESLKWKWPKEFKEKKSYYKEAENETDLEDLRRLQRIASQ